MELLRYSDKEIFGMSLSQTGSAEAQAAIIPSDFIKVAETPEYAFRAITRGFQQTLPLVN